MPFTAISTTKASKDNTTLTIKTDEVLELRQMRGNAPIRLNRGTNNVMVGRGIFKLVSGHPVSVSADTEDTVIISTETKDGSWPDPSLLNVSADSTGELTDFFLDAKDKTVK